MINARPTLDRTQRAGAPWAAHLTTGLGASFVVAMGMAAALAQAPDGPPSVSVAKPVVKDVVERDAYTGRFEAIDFVEVRARVTGYLTKINFRDGAFVKKGDLLFVIDQRPYQALFDQAKAALASTQARVAYSQTDLERAQSLTQTGNITKQNTDQRRQTAETAQADLDSATAALKQAALNLDFTEVRAQVSGRISQRLVTEGNIVVADQTRLTTIVSLDPIYFSFTVDEHSFLTYQKVLGIGLDRDGRQAEPSVLVALTGEEKPTHPGVLDFVDNNVDAATGSILLRATVKNADALIKPGLFGIVNMAASEPYRGVLVPDEAIATNQDKRLVYVVGADGTTTPREVRLGSRIDGYRVVKSGLKGDETIVISGLTRVRPGAKVSPQTKELPPSRS